MTTLLFYKNLVALNREHHQALRLKPLGHMRFAADATAIPIVVGELIDVARQSPIAFVRLADGGMLPAALVGLPGGKNLYLNAQGQWDAPYVPAFVRRYPFVFADTGPDQLTLCIDRDFEGFNESQGEALFEADGASGALVQSALGLLNEFQRQHTLTQNFVQRLDAAGVLSESTASNGSACSTSTNSPRPRLASAASQAGSSEAWCVTMVSNCLVNSRHSVMRRSGAASARPATSASMRCGASNSTWQPGAAAAACSALRLSWPLPGRKPMNAKPWASVSPATLMAVTALLTPGMGITR